MIDTNIYDDAEANIIRMVFMKLYPKLAYWDIYLGIPEFDSLVTNLHLKKIIWVGKKVKLSENNFLKKFTFHFR